MKGIILSYTQAQLIINKDDSNPALGTFNAIVKIEESEPIHHEKWIGSKLEFLLKIPCMQFCGRSAVCSRRKEKICEEATVTVVKDANFWKINGEIYSSPSGLDTDEPGLYS